MPFIGLCKARTAAITFCSLWMLPAITVWAQLTDETQTSPHVPGSAIAKSLEEQIGAGQGDVDTYGSSVYLIKRDPARSIRRGRQLFQRKFTANQGVGPRVDFDSAGDIHDNPPLGAGLADSCAACHGRPRGAAGFGGDVATKPDSRDAPHLFGLGLIEMLADEITQALRAIRDKAIHEANQKGRRVTKPLRAKGIDYGDITAFPNGTVDSSNVEGVNADLRVRPFFHDGRVKSIREFMVGAFNDEMGLQAYDPVLCAATDPVSPVAMVSAAGMVFDPEEDSHQRPPVCDDPHLEDPDEDGVANEIDPAILDHMEFYLLNYFKPGHGEHASFGNHDRNRRRSHNDGLDPMKEIGCTTCHIQNLEIDQDRRIADVETVFDPKRGIFNRLFATATLRLVEVPDGDPYPQLLPTGESFVVRNVFTDLKRHDLGPAFHERNYDGTRITEFVTEPLWGAGSTAPYGHDGRSINLREVILRHGGEAKRTRRAFERLRRVEQTKILEFLESLILFPPDDTASNLDPGNKDGDPQSEHGSINLGALFVIEAEGAE